MNSSRTSLALLSLGVAACSGTVITNGDDLMGGQGSSTSSQGGAGHVSSGGKGGGPGNGGAPASGGAPNAGGSPGSGGTAGCGDLSSDPKHCGACFHDCHGGQCAAGLCQPVQIGEAGPGKHDILNVDDSQLFLATTSDYELWTISRMPKGGGVREQILPESSIGSPRISLLGESLYVRANVPAGLTPAQIFELPKSGGAIISQWEGIGPDRIVADAQYLYCTVWGDEALGNRVFRLNPADKTSEPLAKVPGAPATALAVDDSFLYALVPDDNGTFQPLKKIYRMPKSGGGVPEVIEEDIDSPGMVQNGPHVYYLLRGQDSPNAARSLWRLPKSGGPAVALIELPTPFSLEPAGFDADGIWWIRRDADYSYLDVTVMRSPAEGGKSAEVLTDLVRSTIASDATFLYWVRQSGAIMRLAK